MTIRVRRTLLAALVGAALSCGGTQPESGGEATSGEATIEVQSAALSAADAIKVTLRISGTGISPDIVRDLAPQGSGWRGIIGGIPVGDGRLFHADAYDKYGNIIYQGQATATVEKNKTILVLIIMQQKTPPAPFVNTVPFIDSVVASSSDVAPGDQIALGATGHDVDDGDVLSWTWTCAAGTFDAPNTAITKWTAPATEGQYDVTVTLSDGRGGVRSIVLKVNVGYLYAHGTAIVVADINTWPEIARVTANPGRVAAGEAAALLVSVTDADGDALRYAWSDDCAGRFSDTAAPDPTWNAPAKTPASGLCTLTVVVTDVRGGVNTGTLTVQVGSSQLFDKAPVVLSTFQSDDTAASGQGIDLAVEAIDPEGGALTFTWSASAGTLGTATSTANPSGSTTSQVVWTAPAGVGPFTITVVARDPALLETTRLFTVTGASAGATVDQAQLGVAFDGLLLAVIQQVGQTLVAGRTGQLVGVEMSLVACGTVNDPLATAVLAVSDVSGNVLGQASLPITQFAAICMPLSLVDGTAGSGYFDLSAKPIAVAKGATLFLTLSFAQSAGYNARCVSGRCASSGQICTVDGTCQDSLRVGRLDGNPYLSGNAFFTYAGKTSNLSDTDLAFKTILQ